MAYIKLLLGLLFAAFVSADQQCSSPTVHASSYTSKSIALSAETAYLSELTVNCGEGPASLDLYAEIEQSVIVPVAYIKEGSYQISWAKDHKKATTGKININVYNNEGYNAYRKAQRNEGEVSNVKPFFVVTLNHPGVSREGLFVQTEFLAVVATLLLFWAANSMRNQIME